MMSVMDALTENGGIRKFTAYAYEMNVGSINIMTKLGMKYVKTDIVKDPLVDQEVVYYESLIS